VDDIIEIDRGAPAVYLESSLVSLRDVVGRVVTVHGHTELNTSSDDLPVFVVERLDVEASSTRLIASRDLGISLEIPSTFEDHTTDNTLSIRVPGSAEPLLMIAMQNRGSLPVTGLSLRIAGHDAVRVDRDALHREIYILLSKDNRLKIDVTLPDGDSSSLQSHATDILSSLTFTAASSGGVASSLSSSSFSVAVNSLPSDGQTCGGTAGLLCPQGSYCEITDGNLGMGVCKKAGQQQ
jgi:hypothetical protein